MVNILHLLNVSVGNWEVRVQPVGHAPVEEVVEVLQVCLVVEPVDRGLYCIVLYFTVLYCTVLYCTVPVDRGLETPVDVTLFWPPRAGLVMEREGSLVK